MGNLGVGHLDDGAVLWIRNWRWVVSVKEGESMEGKGGGENRKLLPYPLPCPLTKEIHCHKIIKLKS